MGERYTEGGAWDPRMKERMAAEVGGASALEARVPTIGDALAVTAKMLEGLHAAISEVEQRTGDFRVPSAAPPKPKDGNKPVGLSQVHMAVLDINASIDDAMARLSVVARTIDL